MSVYYQYFDQPASGECVNYQIDLGPSRYTNIKNFGVGFCNIPTGELGRITETGIAEFHTGAFDSYINSKPFEHTYASDFEEGSDVDPMKGVFYLTGDINEVDFITSFTGSNSRMYDQDNNLFYSYGDLFQSPFSIQGNIHEYYQNYFVNGLPVNSNLSRGCSENISGFYYTDENFEYQISVRDSKRIDKWEPKETGSAQDMINFDASVVSDIELSSDGVESWNSTDGNYSFGKWDSTFYSGLETVYTKTILPKINEELIACKDSIFFDPVDTGFLQLSGQSFNLNKNFAIMIVASYEGDKDQDIIGFGSIGVRGSFSLRFDGFVDYNEISGSSLPFNEYNVNEKELNLYTYLFNVEGFDGISKNLVTYLNGLKTYQHNDFFDGLALDDMPDSDCDIKLMCGYDGGEQLTSKGAVAELIILPNIEDEDLESQISKINIFEGYLAHKWNINNKLFASHPYSHGHPPIYKAGLKGGPLENLFGAAASNYTHL